MGASEFNYLCLVPAEVVLSSRTAVPNEEGVYYVFARGGYDLLQAASFFRFSHRDPLTYDDRVHVYIGSSLRMRHRALAHLRGSADQSPLRKTLISLQFAHQAISKTKTPGCDVHDKASFDAWLAANLTFAFIPCEQAWEEEQKRLRSMISPLNVQNRRLPEFGRHLSYLRGQHFPRGAGF